MDKVRAVVLIVLAVAIVAGFFLDKIDQATFMTVATGSVMWLFNQPKDKTLKEK